MEDFAQFIAWVLGIVVLVVFFILVDRVGAILKTIAIIRQQMEEQTRYLAAISMNLAKAARENESMRDGENNAKGI